MSNVSYAPEAFVGGHWLTAPYRFRTEKEASDCNQAILEQHRQDMDLDPADVAKIKLRTKKTHDAPTNSFANGEMSEAA